MAITLTHKRFVTQKEEMRHAKENTQRLLHKPQQTVYGY